MRRVVLAIVLCLLLGLLTSIIIAWGAAASFNAAESDVFRFTHNGWSGTVNRSATVTNVNIRTELVDSAGNPISEIGAPRDSVSRPQWFPLETTPSETEYPWLRGQSAGWPMRCMCFYVVPTKTTFFEDWEDGRHGMLSGVNIVGFVSPSYANDDVELPIKPLVLGVAINTVLYATMWTIMPVLSLAIQRARARKRRSHQKCVSCKYDVTESGEICPECGFNQMASVLFLNKPAIQFLFASTILLSLFVGGTAATVHFWPKRDRVLRAAHNGNIDALKLMLANGVDLDAAVDKRVNAIEGDFLQSFTPLQAAVVGGDIETVEWLINNGANVNNPSDDYLSPFQLTIFLRRINIARLLLDSGFDLHADRRGTDSIIGSAAIHGAIEFIDLLADEGVDFKASKYAVTPAIQTAILRRQRQEWDKRQEVLQTMSRLLDLGCPIAEDELTPVIWSCDTEVLEMLLAHMEEVPAMSSNPSREHTLLTELMNWKCSDEMIQVAIDAGHDVNTPSSTGRTALIAAAEMRTASTVRLLLDNGADPNVRTMQRRTALHFAVFLPDTEKVQLLLGAGADPSVLTQEDMSSTTSEIRDLIEAKRSTSESGAS